MALDQSALSELLDALKAGEGVDLFREAEWSILTDLRGIPIGWAIDGANRNDSVLLAPTLDNAKARGLLATCRQSGSIAATTPRQRVSGLPSVHSMTPSSRAGARRALMPQRPISRWGSAGRWSARTPGSPSSASSVETPIARARPASRSSRWRSSSSSRQSSSTKSAGRRWCHLSVEVLSHDVFDPPADWLFDLPRASPRSRS